jgi:hypothetical protein
MNLKDLEFELELNGVIPQHIEYLVDISKKNRCTYRTYRRRALKVWL